MSPVRPRLSEPRGGVRIVFPHSANGSAVYLYENLGFTTTTPSRVAAGREAKAELEEQLKHLPADFRQLVQSYDLDGEAAVTVAEKIGCTVGAMYMRRARALELLRTRLQHKLDSRL